MNTLSALLTEYRYVFSLINGVAFFTLGLSIILVSEKTIKPRFFGPVHVLAGYGFIAALSNWLRMFMLIQESAASLQLNTFLKIARLFSFISAAITLLRYATQAIAGQDKRFNMVRWLFHVACILYTSVIISIAANPDLRSGDWVSVADVYGRYLMLLPGYVLTSLGLWGEYRRSKSIDLPRITRNLLGACLAFGFKAITSGIFAIPIFSTSQLVDPGAVLAVHLSRVLSTVAIAFFVVRVIRDYETVRNLRLSREVELRFLAQQQTLTAQRQMHAEVEQWARQLEDLVDSVATVMNEVTNIEEILVVSLGKVLELTRFDAGDILLIQEGALELQLVTQSGLDVLTQECKYVMQPTAEPLYKIQTTGESVVVMDLNDTSYATSIPCLEAGFSCLVNVLLVCKGRLLGVMNLLGKSGSMPQANEKRILSAIGQQIGVAIENARLYEQAQSIAALEERERLGRELHDGLAQVLGYLYIKSYNANVLLRSGKIAAAQVELGEMEEVAGESQRDVREAILGLRTTIAPETGIVTTLAEYIRRFSQQSGISTNLIANEETVLDFDPIVEIQLLRIVQEALTNTRKHSNANQAFVKIMPVEDYVMIMIKDDGRGFDSERVSEEGHYGVYTMKERAQSVGGETQIVSKPGHGVEIVVRLPLKQWRMIER